MLDPDLEIRGGGQSSRPLDKGGGGLQTIFFWPFRARLHKTFLR